MGSKGNGVRSAFDEHLPSRQVFTLCVAIASTWACEYHSSSLAECPRPLIHHFRVEKPICKPVQHGLQQSSWRNLMRIRASKTIMAMELLPDFDEITRKEPGGA